MHCCCFVVDPGSGSCCRYRIRLMWHRLSTCWQRRSPVSTKSPNVPHIQRLVIPAARSGAGSICVIPKCKLSKYRGSVLAALCLEASWLSPLATVMRHPVPRPGWTAPDRHRPDRCGTRPCRHLLPRSSASCWPDDEFLPEKERPAFQEFPVARA